MTSIRQTINDAGESLLLKIPEELRGKNIEVVISLLDKKQSTKRKKKYNFSDISGKMNWNGDAIAEQRKIRDEW